MARDVIDLRSIRRIRGAVERTYTLRAAAAQIQPGEAETMTPGEHTHAFTAHIAGLLADVDRYLASNPPDPAREAGYRVGALWLTDAEFADLLLDLRTVFQPRLANPPGKNRRRRMIYTIYLPAPKQEPDDRHPGN